MIASADAERYRAALELVKKDRGVDGIVAIFVSPIMIDAYEVARAIAEAADGSKPVLSCSWASSARRKASQELRRHRVPVYRFPEEAASAMAAMARYRDAARPPRGEDRASFAVDRRRARACPARVRGAPGGRRCRPPRCRRSSLPTASPWFRRDRQHRRPRRSPRRMSSAIRSS